MFIEGVSGWIQWRRRTASGGRGGGAMGGRFPGRFLHGNRRRSTMDGGPEVPMG